MDPLPTFADIEAAAQRLAGPVFRTPVIESARLNDMTGARVLLKPEVLQHTGSFKFRGAYNCIVQRTSEETRGGVVAYSSGNHAQGVAAAATLAGLEAVIVMPDDTPEIKRRNTAGYGATIVTYDREHGDRERIATRIAEEKGAYIIPPYDHRDVIAGQGTVGMELAAQAQEKGLVLDDVLIGTGGGGLTAGMALAFETMSPRTRIWSVEPNGFDDHARSLKSGRRERNGKAAGSICDALLAPQPGKLTFAINRSRLVGGLVVNDQDVCTAMRFAFEVLKLVVEPGGAVALAAVLSGALAIRPESVLGVVLSGGNVDPATHARLIALAS